MAQSRKTIFSLGGPTYLDDPRVAEAQRAQAMRLQEEAQGAQLERAAIEAAAAVQRSQIDAQSRLREAMAREAGWTGRARMQQEGENERARMAQAGADARAQDSLQLSYDRMAQDAALAQEAEAGRGERSQADFLTRILGSLPNPRQVDPGVIAGEASKATQAIRNHLASGWDPESGRLVEGELDAFRAAAQVLGPEGEAAYYRLLAETGGQALGAQRAEPGMLRRLAGAPVDFYGAAAGALASGARALGAEGLAGHFDRQSQVPNDVGWALDYSLGGPKPIDTGTAGVLERAAPALNAQQRAAEQFALARQAAQKAGVALPPDALARLQDQELRGLVEPRMDPRSRLAAQLLAPYGLAGE